MNFTIQDGKLISEYRTICSIAMILHCDLHMISIKTINSDYFKPARFAKRTTSSKGASIYHLEIPRAVAI